MLKFYISESFRVIMRAKLASFISIITLSISITFIVASLILIFLSSKIENSWKNEISINLFINDSVPNNQLSKIKNKILEINEVKNVKYFSKEEAYKKFVELTGDDFKRIIETNPLPRSYTLSFTNKINKKKIEKIIPKLKKIGGVEDVVYDYNLTFTILEYISSIRAIVFILAIFFTSLSFYLLFSTSRLIISERMAQYSTMKLVGAKLSTIKIPLLLTGIIFGVISASICITIVDVFYITFKAFYPHFRFENYIYFINFIIILFGLLLGPVGIGFYTKKISLQIDDFN